MCLKKKIKLMMIGNGFDLFHGYATKYDDFYKYLSKTNYESCYFYLSEIFENEGINWSDFEESLADVTLESTYNSIIPKFNNNDDDKKDEWEWREYQDKTENLVECVNELPLDLIDAMNDWILKATEVKKNRIRMIVDLINKNDRFVNFNFSSSIEDIYKVSSENILHIHGKASIRRQNLDHHDPDFGKYEHADILIGHSKKNIIQNSEKFEAMEEVGIYPSKLCESFIKPLNLTGLKAFLQDVCIKELHIFGHSLSKVDQDYFRLINKLISKDGKVNYYLKSNLTLESSEKKYGLILKNLFCGKKFTLLNMTKVAL